MPLEQVVFLTDGSNTSGTGTEELSGESFWMAPGNILIRDIFQTTCGTEANDGDWQLYIDGIATRYTFTAEELNPANVGRPKWSIGITKGRMVQFKWSGQSAADNNKLKVLFARS